jgi:hypothetical protein
MTGTQVRVMDMNGAQIFHAMKNPDGIWHCSGVNFTGILICTRDSQVMRYISEQGHGMKYWSIEISYPTLIYSPPIHPDPFGNVDYDGKFLSLAEALRKAFRLGDKDTTMTGMEML